MKKIILFFAMCSMALQTFANNPKGFALKVMVRAGPEDGYHLPPLSQFSQSFHLNDDNQLLYFVSWPGTEKPQELYYQKATSTPTSFFHLKDNVQIRKALFSALSGYLIFTENDSNKTELIYVESQMKQRRVLPISKNYEMTQILDAQYFKDKTLLARSLDVDGTTHIIKVINDEETAQKIISEGQVLFDQTIKLISPIHFNENKSLITLVHFEESQEQKPQSLIKISGDEDKIQTIVSNKALNPKSPFINIEWAMDINNNEAIAFIGRTDAGKFIFRFLDNKLTEIAQLNQIQSQFTAGPRLDDNNNVIFRSMNDTGIETLYVSNGEKTQKIIEVGERIKTDAGMATVKALVGDHEVNSDGNVLVKAQVERIDYLGMPVLDTVLILVFDTPSLLKQTDV
ncbi:MAG: hypothetical protein H6621_12115 [Halobacteriovoraceae bacterium]|nr:hypothetical protein [Halobacteriovoraceae bacterium]MCB9095805.1 hypothetical protein [Halobacteriovoraceae bacterium]